MHNVIPLSLAALVAVGIIVIGRFYLVDPCHLIGDVEKRRRDNESFDLSAIASWHS
jgi:hypothetical protein